MRHIAKRPQEIKNTPEDPWIQVAFTLDLESYRKLRDRAEAEHLTLQGFVRESVMEFLKETRTLSFSREELLVKANGRSS